MSEIITGKTIARRDGFATHGERIASRYKDIKMRFRGLEWKYDEAVAGDPVFALIDFGRWSARCECGGSEYVDPDEPVFYCFSCGNVDNGGALRPVKFPSASRRATIEQLVLDRPVDDRVGMTKDQKAFLAKPLVQVNKKGLLLPLSRSWTPDEAISDLRVQNKAIDKWKLEKDGK